jgi:ribosomal protein L11 methyltransferase
MGCGTAVLAILAEMRGAGRVVAIDYDQNAVENARENILKNNCRRVSVLLGTVNEISGRFDVILANINKNVLIRDLNAYAEHLKPDGIMLLSGFYVRDLDELIACGKESSLTFHRVVSKNEWAVARFSLE